MESGECASTERALPNTSHAVYRYVETAKAPVAAFRARLASRTAAGSGLPPPAVYSAFVRVQLRLGEFLTGGLLVMLNGVPCRKIGTGCKCQLLEEPW